MAFVAFDILGVPDDLFSNRWGESATRISEPGARLGSNSFLEAGSGLPHSRFQSAKFYSARCLPGTVPRRNRKHYAVLVCGT